MPNSKDNNFISFLYNLSYPFIIAFHRIFDARALGRADVLEFSTLITMQIYALLVWRIGASSIREMRMVILSTESFIRETTTSLVISYTPGKSSHGVVKVTSLDYCR